MNQQNVPTAAGFLHEVCLWFVRCYQQSVDCRLEPVDIQHIRPVSADGLPAIGKISRLSGAVVAHSYNTRCSRAWHEGLQTRDRLTCERGGFDDSIGYGSWPRECLRAVNGQCYCICDSCRGQRARTGDRLSTASAAAPSGSADDSGPSEVVVTGSRIVRDGYEAPTPVSVMGTSELNALNPVNVADAVNLMPAFSNSVTGRSRTAICRAARRA